MSSSWNRRVVVVAAALAAVVAAHAPAAAQSGGGPTTTQTHKILGKDHQFTVPNGWTFTPGENKASFGPPTAGMIGVPADFVCVVTAFEGTMGTTPVDFVKAVGESQQKDTMPWATLTDPSEINFAGVPGGLIILAGNNPNKNNQNEAEVIVVAQIDNLIYLFVSYGRIEDVNLLASDMSIIIGGVRPGVASSGPSGPKNGPKNGPKGGPKGDGGFQKAPGPQVDDTHWGLKVTGLSSNWQMINKKGKYVFYSSSPEAEVTVTHAWADKNYVKKLKGATKSDLAGLDAWLVEGKTAGGAPQHTYHVVVGDQATVITFASPDFDKAAKNVFPEFEKSLSLKEQKPPARGSKKGVAMALTNGVMVNLPKPWELLDFVAGGAAYRLQAGKFATVVQLKAAKPLFGGDQPFRNAYNDTKIHCQANRGVYKESSLSIKGMTTVTVMRCGPPAVQAKGEDKVEQMVIVVAESPSVHLMLIGWYYQGQKLIDMPDDALTEFFSHVALP